MEDATTPPPGTGDDAPVRELAAIGAAGPRLSIGQARTAIRLVSDVFRAACSSAGMDQRSITAFTTKFRDAGRRSAPWRPTSSRVPGRPQDGADGNRINRWLLPHDHKFYASELDATLVEIRYFFQALSMHEAPPVPSVGLLSSWEWLTEGAIGDGQYLDPIQLVPIRFPDFNADRRSVTSGHFYPLNRGGRHVPSNTFLTLKVSNDLQGDHTLDELLDILDHIVEAHRRLRGWTPGTTHARRSEEHL